MHELLLYGQVPFSRHEQLMNVLAGLTAMQPHRLVERHALFKPIHGPVQAQVQKGGTQGLNPTKKVLDEKECEASNDAMDVDDHVTENAENKESWQWQFRDIPEGGKRSATFRMAEDIDISAGDPQAYMEGLGYRYVSEHIVEGHRFVLNNTVIFLHRILQWSKPIDPPSINTPVSIGSAEPKPLDPSRGYILELKIRLSQSDPALIKIGEDQLLGLKTRLLGVVELKVPERLAFDTRVK
ncbi:hypothetical protein BLS_000630 [Venturia inaequalis]|uniref:Mediator of RNA polymerase II transcription subunit 18 n=1 Tax=Venturia inaequalis TaxID=5025 RepID=A0A8H3UKU9_VENIN|nr:hypothetical protein BLS_000630 [Venturia inaequalis]KAE9971043.1 hypothetical protein EG328_005922 [Venturia inaequalis]